MDTSPAPSAPATHGGRTPWWSPLRTPGRTLRRAATPRWSEGVATPQERDELVLGRPDRPGVSGAQAQDYLAWRRSVLAIVSAVLLATAVIHLVEWGIALAQGDAVLFTAEDGRELRKSDIFDVSTANLLDFLLLGANWLIALAALRGLMKWDALSTSHKSLRIGWFVGFLLPFVVALVPVSSLLKSFGEEEGQRQAREAVAQLVGTLTGFQFFVALLPSVLSVLVGAMRASLNAKRFAPESPVPGWIAAACAPVFVLLLLAVIVVLNQVGGSVLLVIAFALIASAFLVFPMRATLIAAPCARADVDARVGASVRRYRGLLVLGALLGLIALFTMKFFGKPFVGFGGDAMIGPFGLVKMLLEFTGKSLFIALLFTDAIVALLRYAWSAPQAAPYADLGAALEDRFRELEAAGLAGLARAKPAPAAPPATT